MEALIMMAERDGPMMFARIGVMLTQMGVGRKRYRHRPGSGSRLTGLLDKLLLSEEKRTLRGLPQFGRK
jgi:hypothetical protein